MGFDSTFCQEKPLNAAGNVKKYFKSLFVPFIFLILSCWMSSSNKVIWIFVSFIGLITIVSGNGLNFFNGFEFSHLEISVSKLITTAS